LEGNEVIEAPPVVEVRGVSKSFGATRALDHIDLAVARGSVHAVVGHNGAGKSTLMRILAGVTRPDRGETLVDGAEVHLRDPADALSRGISMVHQELSVLPDLTVAENLLLGREPVWLSTVVSRRKLHARASELLAAVGLAARPDALSESLSIGDLQLIEIARAVSRRCSLLILDEPTTALTDPERRRLFGLIESLKERGIGILYVSHRLSEVLEIADTVTVLRDGRIVTCSPAERLTESELVEAMVGHAVSRRLASARERTGAQNSGAPALEVVGLTSGLLRVISFSVGRGEVLGLAGMLGSGRTELLEAIFGARPISSGEVRVSGQAVELRRPMDAMAAGVCLISKDRKRQGIFPGLSLWQNVAFAGLADRWRSKFGLVSVEGVRSFTRNECAKLAVAAPSINEEINRLSGGNQQKVIVARWLSRNPAVLLLNDPTAGIDVAAKASIYGIIRELAQAGAAVVLSSSEFSDLIDVSDRILVLKEGRLFAETEASTVTEADLVHLASGQPSAYANEIA
jgi:ABC-type sugar transport system ATPase subunit